MSQERVIRTSSYFTSLPVDVIESYPSQQGRSIWKPSLSNWPSRGYSRTPGLPRSEKTNLLQVSGKEILFYTEAKNYNKASVLGQSCMKEPHESSQKMPRERYSLPSHGHAPLCTRMYQYTYEHTHTKTLVNSYVLQQMHGHTRKDSITTSSMWNP